MDESKRSNTHTLDCVGAYSIENVLGKLMPFKTKIYFLAILVHFSTNGWDISIGLS